MTIADFQTRLEGKIHSRNIDQVNDFFGLCLEAAGNVLNQIDPRTTKRKSQITNAIYDEIDRYVLPSDLKADAVIDIERQASRTISDNFNQVGSETFSLNKTAESFSVEDNSGVRTLRLSASGLKGGVTVHTCDSLTINGTWSAGGSATNLIADTLNFISGSGSIKFDVAAAGSSSYIENTTFTAVDLSNVKNTGALFVWVYIPDTTVITSVNLRWGSSSTNYYAVTVTATQDNTAFVTGWNLLRFDWSGLTPTGTPVDTAIDYLRVTFNHSASATTSCRVDSIIARIGTIYNILYYSKYLFRTSSGTWIEKPTLTTDIINLDTDEYNLFLYEMAELVAQELQKKDASFDVKYWMAKKKEVWDEYKRRNKSQSQKRQSSYYSTANKRRR